MWGAGFRDGTRTRINVNIGTQSVSRALLSERDSRRAVHRSKMKIMESARRCPPRRI